MLLYTILSTFLYFQQAAIVDAIFADRGGPDARSSPASICWSMR